MATQQFSPIENLPNEVESLILGSLPDIQSLLSIVLSSRSIHSTFRTDERNLVRNVLRRQFPPELLDDAVAVWTARCRSFAYRWDILQIQEFFRGYLWKGESLLAHCNLSTALQLSRFHSMVENIAQDFTQTLTRQAKRRLTLLTFPAITADEMTTITRALYRFELYCIFFANPNTLVQPQPQSGAQSLSQREVFWVHFAPREMEQLASLSEYFETRLVPFFEALAFTNPVWGLWFDRLGALTYGRESFSQAHMANGLQYMQDIFSLDLDRQQDWPRVYQHFDDDFINTSLDYAVQPTTSTLRAMEANGILLRSITSSMFTASDIGPEVAWRWAHKREASCEDENCGWVRNYLCTQLRECGYVFWDIARLSQWAIMSKPFRPPGCDAIFSERDAQEEELRKKLKQKVDDWYEDGTLPLVGQPMLHSL